MRHTYFQNQITLELKEGGDCKGAERLGTVSVSGCEHRPLRPTLGASAVGQALRSHSLLLACLSLSRAVAERQTGAARCELTSKSRRRARRIRGRDAHQQLPPPAQQSKQSHKQKQLATNERTRRGNKAVQLSLISGFPNCVMLQCSLCLFR